MHQQTRYLAIVFFTVACGDKAKPTASPDAGVIPPDATVTDSAQPQGTCVDPLPLLAQVPLSGSLLKGPNRLNPMASDCLGLDPNSRYNGPDVVFQTTIPAGKTLRVSVDTKTPWDSALLILDEAACQSRPSSCLASRDLIAGSTVDEFVTFQNKGAQDREVLVVLEALLGEDAESAPGEYELIALLGDPPSGEACTEPVTIDDSRMARGDLTFAGSHFAPSAQNCPGLYADSQGDAFEYSGGDQFFAVAIPARTTLEATVSPSQPPFDVAMYVLSNAQCMAAMPACLAGADSYPTSGHTDNTETVTYDNAGDSALDVLLGVEAASLGPPGAFTLSVAFAPIVVVDAGVNVDATPVDASVIDGNTAPDAAAPPDATPGVDGGGQ